jgi:hypothetical protein
MTDEELIARLRDLDTWVETADVPDLAADRIEALTEQLEAACADAKEAEAYAEELERERDEARKYRDAYAECDRIGTQAVRDLEARLAKAVEALREIENAEIRFDYVTFIRNADGTIDHEAPASPFDRGKAQAYAECQKIARATLAEIEGGKDD